MDASTRDMVLADVPTRGGSVRTRELAATRSAHGRHGPRGASAQTSKACKGRKIKKKASKVCKGRKIKKKLKTVFTTQQKTKKSCCF